MKVKIHSIFLLSCCLPSTSVPDIFEFWIEIHTHDQVLTSILNPVAAKIYIIENNLYPAMRDSRQFERICMIILQNGTHHEPQMFELSLRPHSLTKLKFCLTLNLNKI